MGGGQIWHDRCTNTLENRVGFHIGPGVVPCAILNICRIVMK